MTKKQDHRIRQRAVSVGSCNGLRWLAVLFFAAGILIQFACGIAAEHNWQLRHGPALSKPRFPAQLYQSVMATIERRVDRLSKLAKELHVSLEQNGSLVQQQFSQHDDDRFAISLWCRRVRSCPDGSECLRPAGRIANTSVLKQNSGTKARRKIVSRNRNAHTAAE